jgi:two-component system response regulator YesN
MGKLSNLLSSMSFKRKLIAYSLLISILPVLLLGLASSYLAAKSIQEEVDYNHEVVLKQIQYQLNNFIRSLNTTSIELASSVAVEKSIKVGPAVENLNHNFEMIETIRKHQSISLIKNNASLIYKKFNYVHSNSYNSIPFEGSIFDQIIRNVQPKFNSSFMVVPNTFQNQKELLFFRPVPLHSFYTDGVLVLHVSIDELSKFLDQLPFPLGNHRKILIVDETGRIVISQNKEEIGTKLTSSTDLYHFWSNPESFDRPFSLKGVEYKLSAQKSSYNNWMFIAMTPVKELARKSEAIQKLMWGMIVALTLLWMLVSVIGSRRLYFPIERLLQKFILEQSQERANTDGLQVLDSFLHQMVTANDRLKNQLNDQLPYLKESIFRQMLLGELSNSEIREKAKSLNLPLKGTCFYVCIVKVDEYVHFMQIYREKDRSLIHYALCKIMEEICGETMPCITLATQPGQVAVIIGMDKVNEASDQAVQNKVDEFRSSVKKYFPFTVSVSISQARKEYISMNTSYQEALALLSYRLLMGHNVTISANEFKAPVKQSGRTIIQWQKNIVFNVIEGNLEEANNLLAQMIEEIPRNVRSSETVMGLFSYLIGELDYLIYEMGFQLSDFFEEDLYKHLYGLTTLNEVQTWMAETIFPTIKGKLESLNVSKQKRMIQQVLHYLHENFNTDVSLQQVADHFQVSPSHLSRIFKEETDTNFGEYLIVYRMNKAKQWLEHTDMPIKEISERLCYSTVQNFSRIFRQMVGIPPGEYRKQVSNEI